VSAAVFTTPYTIARTDTDVGTDTRPVRSAKDVDVLPAGIVSMETAGDASVELFVEMATFMGPGAAAHSSVTDPVTAFPPTTGLGDKVSARALIGRTVIFTALLTPPYAAVTTPTCGDATYAVGIDKDFVIAPTGMTTELGNWAAGMASVRVIGAPVDGAAPVRLNLVVPMPQPPITVVGERENADSTGGTTVITAVFVTSP
jgi:hypothetical protein